MLFLAESLFFANKRIIYLGIVEVHVEFTDSAILADSVIFADRLFLANGTISSAICEK